MLSHGNTINTIKRIKLFYIYMNFFKLKQLFFALKLKKLKRDQKKFIFKKLLYSLFSLPIIFLVQKYQTKKNLECIQNRGIPKQ